MKKYTIEFINELLLLIKGGRRIGMPFAALFLLFNIQIFAQSHRYPSVGERLDNYTFTDLDNYPLKSLSLESYRGRWLVLDFWGYSCSACIAGFKKMDLLQQKFGDKIKVILVGATKGRLDEPAGRVERITKDLFSRKKVKDKLTLTAAFDSVLYLKYDVGALPQLLVINPEGVVVAKTVAIDEMQMEEFINGGQPVLQRSYSYSEKRESTKYKDSLPLLTGGRFANGGIDTSFIFRSLIVRNTDRMPFGRRVNLFKNANKYVESGRLEVFQYRLSSLYKLAYFGANHWDKYDSTFYANYYPIVILEGNDSSKFAKDMAIEYAYSSIVPKQRASAELFMSILRDDLQSYFGHSVQLSRKPVSVYNFVTSDLNKLSQYIVGDATGEEKFESSYNFIKVKNFPLKKFLDVIGVYLHLDAPDFDETNVDKIITMNFEANMLDEDSILKSLANCGLALRREKKEMMVLTVHVLDKDLREQSYGFRK